MPSTIHSEAFLQTPSDIARALLNGFGHLKLAIAFGTADAAVLFTVPTNIARIELGSLWWEVTTSFSGGASSAIGCSSSNASYNTKGDLLGGASGDVAATLVSTGVLHKGGTIGAKFGSNGKVVLVT